MNRKFEFKGCATYTPEVIELLSINVLSKIETEYIGLELLINQHEEYRIIFIDKHNELREATLDSLASLKPL